jgi:O-antigen ligase
LLESTPGAQEAVDEKEASPLISILQEEANKLRRLLLIAGVVVTFTFWFPMDDPMNIPKMFVLFLCTAWIAGTMVVTSFYHRSKKFSLGEWALLAFVIGLLAAAVFSDVRYTAFVGAAHRNNGALSYLALAILALAAMRAFDLKSLHQFRSVLLLVGAISTLYGLLQTTGNDPFKWNLYYNAVIGTLGNPDFFSALVGVCAIATVWFLVAEGNLRLRVPGIVLLLLEIFIVKRGGSFQGLLAFAIGATILVLVKLWQVQKRIGLIALVAAGLGGILVFIGLLNKGPFASLVYRSSIKNRQDYWGAAFSMFKARPIAGVGIERFGENYPIYAPQVQVVQGQGTDNAHNVILHLLATGGLLVIIPYLLLIGLIFWSAVRGIRNATGANQIDMSALFSIWFALLLISLVSIDNLGVTIWFWISGGALYAITRSHLAPAEAPPKQGKGKGKSPKKVQEDNANYLAPVASFILLVIVLGLMVPVVRTSGTLYQLSGNTGRLTQQQYVAKLKAVSNSFPRNTQTLTVLADLALRASDTTLALEFTKSILKVDSKSQNGNLLRARAYEISKRYASAISSRDQLMKLDPWNTGNMLEIVRDFLFLKDVLNAQAMADEIAQLRPGSPEDVAAAALIKG